MSLRKLKWRGIGRLELLQWINEFLETDYTKIEHLADGVAYCQIFDALHPGKVNLHQLNFHARTDMEFERNLQVLRRTFHQCDIKKEIPIRKLVQGVFQEHFEFLHWIHDYVQRTCPDAVRSYRGLKRRQEALGQSPALCTNTNLIPKYSSSLKLIQDNYVDGSIDLTLDLDTTITNEEAAGEEESNSVEEEQPVQPIQEVDDLSGMDPALELVRHSFRSTLRARNAVGKLGECIESVGVGCPKPQSKKNAARSSKPRQGAKITQRPTKVKVSVAFEDPTWPDPMVCRSISDLLEFLEAELLGRVKDMEFLEKNIEQLLQFPNI